MLFGICQAVYNCHVKKIIHRDIKPENILLNSQRRIKLGESMVRNWVRGKIVFFRLQLILEWLEC